MAVIISIIFLIWTATGNTFFCSTGNGVCTNRNMTCTQGEDCLVQCMHTSFNNQCFGATINCPDGFNCEVECGGHQSCSSFTVNGNKAASLNITTTTTGGRQLAESLINCPTDTDSTCNIECDNMDHQCYNLEINAEQSNSLKLKCYTTEWNAKNDICTLATVRCPMTNNVDGSCLIQGVFKDPPYTKDMKIYSKYGFSTVEIAGNFRDFGTMYCNHGYSQQCVIGNNACSGSTICDNPILIATNDPTLYPINSPTVSPTFITNPSVSPTNDPLTSLNPSVSPTSYPSQQSVYTANYTIIINGSDPNRFANLSATILAIIDPNGVNLVTTEIRNNTIKIFLSVESDTLVDPETIQQTLVALYGDDLTVTVIYEYEGRVSEVSTTDDMDYDSFETNDKSSNTGVVASLSIIGALFVICIASIVYVYCVKPVQSISKKKKESIHTIGNGPTTNIEMIRVISVSEQTYLSKVATKSGTFIVAESPETEELETRGVCDTEGNGDTHLEFEDMYDKPRVESAESLIQGLNTMGNNNSSEDEIYNDVKTPKTPRENNVLNTFVDGNTLDNDTDDEDIYKPVNQDENERQDMITPFPPRPTTIGSDGNE